MTEAAGNLSGLAIVVFGNDAMALFVFEHARGAGGGNPKGDVQTRGERGGGDAGATRSAGRGRVHDASLHFARELVNALTDLGRLEWRHIGRRIFGIERAAKDVRRADVDRDAVGRARERGADQRRGEARQKAARGKTTKSMGKKGHL